MEVQNYKEMNDEKQFALFDIYIPALRMHLKNWKLRKSKQGKLFVAGPMFSVEQHNEKKWFPYVSFDPPKDDDFLKELKELLNAFLPLQLQFQPHQPKRTQEKQDRLF